MYKTSQRCHDIVWEFFSTEGGNQKPVEQRKAGRAEKGENRREIGRPDWKRFEDKRRWVYWQTSEVKPGPELRRLVSKVVPKAADEHCWEERSRWKLLENLQEQLGRKQLIYVQLQFWCHHLFLSTRPDLMHSASQSTTHPKNWLNQSSFSVRTVWCFNKTKNAQLPHFYLDWRSSPPLSLHVMILFLCFQLLSLSSLLNHKYIMV